MVTKQAYRQARRTLRDNGNYGMRWLPMDVRMVMSQLQRQRRDPLEARVTNRRGPDGFTAKQVIEIWPLAD